MKKYISETTAIICILTVIRSSEVNKKTTFAFSINTLTKRSTEGTTTKKEPKIGLIYLQNNVINEPPISHSNHSDSNLLYSTKVCGD